MIKTNKDAVAYLRPIADGSTLPNYAKALELAIRALETVDELTDKLDRMETMERDWRLEQMCREEDGYD